MIIYVYIFVWLFAFSTSAYAEVMDKEPTLLLNYIWGISGDVLCFLSARYRPLLLLLTGSISLFYFYGLVQELRDPYVGPDIAREAGIFYVVSSYLLPILILGSIAAGLIIRRKKENITIGSTADRD